MQAVTVEADPEGPAGPEGPVGSGDQGVVATLDAVDGLYSVRIEAEARSFELAAHFADLHAGEGLPTSRGLGAGTERAVQVGGTGTPRSAGTGRGPRAGGPGRRPRPPPDRGFRLRRARRPDADEHLVGPPLRRRRPRRAAPAAAAVGPRPIPAGPDRQRPTLRGPPPAPHGAGPP